MPSEPLLTSILLLIMFVLLIKEWSPPEVTVFITLAALMVTGILSIEEGLIGFSNPGVHTVALLFIIGSAAYNSGVLSFISHILLSNNKKNSTTLIKMMIPVSIISAFMNNTPIVTMLTPTIRSWAKKQCIAPSKLLIPLSYAAILGGTITLIGTSTNLVIDGLLKQKGLSGFSMFDFIFFGIPITIAGIIYISFIGHHLLPNRIISEPIDQLNKQYIFECLVPAHSLLIGKTIQKAKLRELNDLFLVQIQRNHKKISPPSNCEVLQTGDRLIFSGNASSMLATTKTKGLKLLSDVDRNVTDQLKDSILIEVIVSDSSPLIDKKIKESYFRSKYNAAIVAVQRKNKKITSSIGNIIVKPGDTLLLITGKDFVKTWSKSEDFYLISPIHYQEPYQPLKIKIITSVLIGVILLASLQILSILHAALIGVMILFVTKSVSVSDAQKALNWNVLILMSSSIGIGAAFEKAGLASIIATFFSQTHAIVGLFGIAILYYLTTTILTEIINNIAAATLMFPIGFSLALDLGADPLVFAMITAISASCSFITPIGYQTNLIVYGPGGYRFTDYVKVGLPLSLLCMLITVTIAILSWG
ncbi:hypothetical protein BKP45_19115 [Anaerobacillus alkalidiazotrophicus]|uniref:RCK C-terminal domain-containing protein n=2 Tax=Anaerobacillus alkalidiazotrophicus TaxID=472963 RepID=A0A1S2M1K8_9BACI|nr:hypothetical protein BKP45_19115 [Anaerobacillus alkalidiazotrophicus]